MKKIIIIILCTVLFIPNLLADMGAPAIDPYEVVVKSSSGATVYRREEKENEDDVYVATKYKIAPGEVFKINDGDEDASAYLYFNYIDEGKEYVKIISEKEYDINKSDSYMEGFVATKDLAAVKQSYKFVEKEWEKAQNITVLTDLDIRVGVGYSYKSTGVTIPAGTTLKARECIKEGGCPWYYVEYNGTKGYISSYIKKIGFNPFESTFIAYQTADLIDPKTGNVIETLKPNTIKNAKIYYLDQWSRGYYVEYEGKKGIFTFDDIIVKDLKVPFTLKEDLKLLKSLDFDKKTEKYGEIGTVNKGTTFESSYYDIWNDSVIVFYENDSIKGWLKAEFDASYDKNDNISKVDLLKNSVDAIPLEDEEEIEEPVESEDTQVDNHLVNPNSSNTKKTIYTAIIVALVLFITAIVTVILINKKKMK